MRHSRLALLPIALALLSGCASGNIAGIADTSGPLCAAVTQTCVSKDDRLTELTARQIEANNLARLKICRPPEGEDPCGHLRTTPAKVAQSKAPTS